MDNADREHFFNNCVVTFDRTLGVASGIPEAGSRTVSLERLSKHRTYS